MFEFIVLKIISLEMKPILLFAKDSNKKKTNKNLEKHFVDRKTLIVGPSIFLSDTVRGSVILN